MNIVMASDHAGFELKESLKKLVTSLGHTVNDVGAHAYDAEDDYPDFALALSKVILAGKADRGILLCGSGIGASVAAKDARAHCGGNGKPTWLGALGWS